MFTYLGRALRVKISLRSIKQKMSKISRRLHESKAICGYWDRPASDNLSAHLDSEFCREKAREKAPIYRRSAYSTAALSNNDDLNSHCLWWQTCVKVRLEFKFGSFVIYFFLSSCKHGAVMLQFRSQTSLMEACSYDYFLLPLEWYLFFGTGLLTWIIITNHA